MAQESTMPFSPPIIYIYFYFYNSLAQVVNEFQHNLYRRIRVLIH